MYINTETSEYPLTEDQVKASFQNVSFPDPFVAPAPFTLVEPVGAPGCDPLTQRVHEVAPVLDGDVFRQAWEIVELAEEEREEAASKAIAAIEAAIDAHLDSVAQQYRFSDRTRLALRAAYPNPWQQLAIAFGTWMDTCNALAASWLQDFLDGEIQLQTPEQVIAQLPEFVAP